MFALISLQTKQFFFFFFSQHKEKQLFEQLPPSETLLGTSNLFADCYVFEQDGINIDWKSTNKLDTNCATIGLVRCVMDGVGWEHSKHELMQNILIHQRIDHWSYVFFFHFPLFQQSGWQKE